MELLIGDVFRNAGRAVPDRVAAVVGSRSITFGEIDRLANRLAHALQEYGVGRGDRVAVWAATNLDVIPLFAALAKLGAVFAPVSAALSAAEVADLLTVARPAVVLADEERVGLLDAPTLALAHVDARARREPDGDTGPCGRSETDPHVVFFTSGSTGRPKGAVLSHRVNVLRTHPGALPEPRGAMVCPYPLIHMGAWTIALQQWQARDRVVFLERAEAAAICEAVGRHRATRINCVPAVWRRVLEHQRGGGVDLESVRFADTGTSVTPIELLEEIASAVPQAQLRVFYGSTEAGSVAVLEHADFRRKPGSCGVPGPLAEVRVADDGELWVRGPLLFDGYLGDEEATGEALVDGWYRTGDLAEIDGEGYLSIIGRARDVIRTGGETVSPLEVEAALAAHPAIADLAVVGVPDPEWGEIVCVAVVVAPGHSPPGVSDLRRHCAGRLAAFKQPRRVAVVEEIPRTSTTAQVQRRLLVERLS